MNGYSDALNQLVARLATAVGVPATRDPSQVAGLAGGAGLVFVGFPAVADRALASTAVDVPVSLVHAAPADLQAGDWLLDHMDAFLNACQADLTSPGSLEVGSLLYPAVTVQVRLLI